MQELAKAGDDAGVVEQVGKWEAANGLGDDAAALLALRDRAALNIALAAKTTAALRVFRTTYADSPLVVEALKAETDLAFDHAQDEGTAVAMRNFLGEYPASPYRAQALTLEDGLAFQEAAAIGTPEAIAEFRKYHPSSPYLATAWEAIAAHTPGITLLLPDGTAYLLPNSPVTDGKLPPEPSPAMASARPWVAVNVAGTGRGATSEWWGLYAVADDGTLQTTSPLGSAIAAHVGSAPTGMLDLVAAQGAHTARVAGPAEPLVAPGACVGTAHFAFVLTSPDGARSAWTFGVACDVSPTAPGKGQALPPDAAGPDFLAALVAAEGGDAAGASVDWDKALGEADGSRLLAWFAALDPATDPKLKWVTHRPATGDVLAWKPAAVGADGHPMGQGTTTWWHNGPDGAVALAQKDGLWIVDGGRVLRSSATTEAVSASAEAGCKAGAATRTGLSLGDVSGGPAVDVPFLASPRGGSLVVQHYEAGNLTVLEQPIATGCAKPAPVAPPRSVSLSSPASPSTDPAPQTSPGGFALAPAWVLPNLATAAGYSVVGAAPIPVWGAFTK